jgi:hypothetical protein
MPSAAFASGLLNTFLDKQTQERDRREANTRDTINFLISTGRVRDYNDLLPVVNTLFSAPPPGVQGGGKGAKGQPDPHQVLAQFLNPAFQMQQEADAKANTGSPTTPMTDTRTVGGQGRPSFAGAAEVASQPPVVDANGVPPVALSGTQLPGGGTVPSPGTPGTQELGQAPTPRVPGQAPGQPPPPAATTAAAAASQPPAPPAAAAAMAPVAAAPARGRGPLMSNDEVQQLKDTAQQHAADISFGTEQKRIQAQGAERLKQIAEANKAKGGTGTLQGRVNLAFQDFEDKNGRPPTAEEATGLVDDARKTWQSAGKKVTDQESYTKSWLDEAKSENGGKLTPGQERMERLKARKAWAVAGQAETGAEKLNRAKMLKDYGNKLTTTSPDDLRSLSQSVKVAGQLDQQYLDISTFSGKEKAQAAAQAMAMGIVPVTAKQVEQLEAISATSANLQGFKDQIESKLPKDAAGRPIGAAENQLKKYFQTDDALASAVSWDVTVIPTLRALSLTGRVTNQELKLGYDSRPKLTDTVAVAQKKLDTLNQILANSAKPIVTRGAGGGVKNPPAAPAGGGGATAPAGGGGGAITPALRASARQRLVSLQQQGKIPATVTIDDAAIDKYLSVPANRQLVQ